MLILLAFYAVTPSKFIIKIFRILKIYLVLQNFSPFPITKNNCNNYKKLVNDMNRLH